MRMPNDVRLGFREKLWDLADQLDWARLGWSEKAACYEKWSRDPEIGGVLAHYMDQRRVRVYIKDTLMKGYVRDRLSSPERVMRALGLLAEDLADSVIEDFERPHGRLLRDGRVIAWANARDWKAVLLALHERSFMVKGARPFGAVLFSARGRFDDALTREMILDAARKLEVEKVVWLD